MWSRWRGRPGGGRRRRPRRADRGDHPRPPGGRDAGPRAPGPPRAAAGERGQHLAMELMRSWGLEERGCAPASVDVELQPWVCETLAAAPRRRMPPPPASRRASRARSSARPGRPACPRTTSSRCCSATCARSRPRASNTGTEVAAARERARRGPRVGCATSQRRTRAGSAARYLIAADGVRQRGPRRARHPDAAGRPELGERLSALFRAPLWDLLGDAPLRHLLSSPRRRGRASSAGGSPATGGCSRPTGIPSREGLAEPRPRRRYALDPARGRHRRARAADRARGARSPSPPVAERFRDGSVFLMGDAAHRVTPRGGTGPEHRDPRRLRPRLEARLGAARLGRATRSSTPTRPSADPSSSTTRRARPTRTGRGSGVGRSCAPTSAAASPTCGCRASGRRSTLDLLGEG